MMIIGLTSAQDSFWEYKLIDVQKDFDSAKNYCVNEFGGTLAIPSD
jgi:hypothetical protein